MDDTSKKVLEAMEDCGGEVHGTDKGAVFEFAHEQDASTFLETLRDRGVLRGWNDGPFTQGFDTESNLVFWRE